MLSSSIWRLYRASGTDWFSMSRGEREKEGSKGERRRREGMRREKGREAGGKDGLDTLSPGEWWALPIPRDC